MDEENRNHEAVVEGFRAKTTIYISDSGMICLQQDCGQGEHEVQTTCYDPDGIDNLVDYLRDYQQKAAALPTQTE